MIQIVNSLPIGLVHYSTIALVNKKNRHFARIWRFFLRISEKCSTFAANLYSALYKITFNLYFALYKCEAFLNN